MHDELNLAKTEHLDERVRDSFNTNKTLSDTMGISKRKSSPN